MKLKTAQIVTIFVVFTLGITVGAIVEKRYGFRNILKGNFQRSSPSETSDSMPQKYQGKLQLFILAGQSNMAGMGEIPRSQPKTNPKIS
jgi:hypothetical protein